MMVDKDVVKNDTTKSEKMKAIVCKKYGSPEVLQIQDVVDAFNDPGHGALALPQKLERHHADVPVDSAGAQSVVRRRPDDSRHMSAMTVFIHGLGVPDPDRRNNRVLHHIDTVIVVRVPVSVIVDAVETRRPVRLPVLPRVAPEIFFQVGMVEIDTGVQNRDHDPGVAGREVPCPSGVDIGSRGPAGLAAVQQMPLLGKKRVVGNFMASTGIIGFGPIDGRVLAEAFKGLLEGRSFELQKAAFVNP